MLAIALSSGDGWPGRQRGFVAWPQQDQPGASAVCRSSNVVALEATSVLGFVALLLAFEKLQHFGVGDLLPETAETSYFSILALLGPSGNNSDRPIMKV